jgi:hypothetical protein
VSVVFLVLLLIRVLVDQQAGEGLCTNVMGNV